MSKHFICTSDLSKELLLKIIEESKSYKSDKNNLFQPLKGKVIALWFSLPSTRTRISFCTAIAQLGGYPMIVNPQELQIHRGESLPDTLKSLSGYIDAMIVRTSNHDDLLEIKAYASFPIINALTSLLHPCQSIADLLTILEYKSTLEDLKVVYLGEGNNVCHSLMIACAMMGISLTISTPTDSKPANAIYQHCLNILGNNKNIIQLNSNPKQAVEQANIIYTDVWTSMGGVSKNLDKFMPYQVNEQLLKYAAKEYAVMHCLPAHRGEEIEAHIIDGPFSLIWKQANNRLHTQKAILTNLLAS